MPRIGAQGEEVFSLSEDGSAYGGLVEGRYHVEAGARYAAGVELCHGLRAEVGTEAFARAEGALAANLVALEAEAQVRVAAGLEVDLRLSPDVFDGFGLTAAVRAYVEAAVAARLQVGLRTEVLVQQVEGELGPGVGAALFAALARRLTVEAGVWGKASFAASAEAYVLARGRLAGPDPGFEIGVGAGAAVKAGASFEFYGRVGFDDDLAGFFDEAAGLLADALADAVGGGASGDALGLAMRVGLRAGFELGLETARTGSTGQAVGDRFVAVCAEELQRYTLGRLAEAGAAWLGSALGNLSDVGDAPDTDGGADRDAALRDLEGVATRLEAGPVGLSELGTLLAALDRVAPSVALRVSEPAALVWCALVAATEGTSTALPDAPGPVLDRVRDVLPGSVPRLTRATALRYLAAAGLAPVLRARAPGAAAVLDRLDGVAAAAAAGPGYDTVGMLLMLAEDPRTALRPGVYHALRTFVADAVDDALADGLTDRIAALPADEPRRPYLEEVVVPTLAAVPRVLLRRLDGVVAGDGTSPADFRRTLGVLAYRVVASNVVVLFGVLTDHVIDGLPAGFRALEREVEAGALDRVYDQAWTALPAAVRRTLPAPAPTPAVRGLAADLAAAGAEAFGPGVWTAARRDRLHGSVRDLLYSFTFADVDELDAHFERLGECSFVPDVDGLDDLYGVLLELADDELDVVLRHVVPAWVRFYSRVAEEGLEALVELAKSVVEDASDLLKSKEALQGSAKAAVAAAVAAVDAAVDALGVALAAVDAWLLSRIDVAIAAVRAEAERTVRQLAPDAFGVEDDLVSLLNQILDDAEADVRELFLEMDAVRLELRGAATLAGHPDPVGAIQRRLRSRLKERVAALRLPVPFVVGGFTVLDLDAFLDAAVDALFPPTLSQLVAAAVRDGHEAVQEQETTLATRREELVAADKLVESAVQERVGLYDDDERRGALTIEVLSPHAASDGAGDRFAYGRSVPLYVVVRGALASFVGGGGTDRVEVLVNGSVVAVPPGAWSYDTRRRALVLRLALEGPAGGVVSGVNVLEVRASDGRPDRPRTAQAVVPFLADLTRVAAQTPLRVDAAASQFDAPGNDHRARSREYVTLRNGGSRALALGGWRLRDRRGHTFVFPDVTVGPDEAVRVVTGDGRDRSGGGDPAVVVHWGMGQAVWNNRGDALYVVDRDGLLVAEHVY